VWGGGFEVENCPEGDIHACIHSPSLLHHIAFLAFLGVHTNITDEETVRIFQEGSAKNATEGNKSEEKEVTIQL
jgi:hypothetical protein